MPTMPLRLLLVLGGSLALLQGCVEQTRHRSLPHARSDAGYDDAGGSDASESDAGRLDAAQTDASGTVCCPRDKVMGWGFRLGGASIGQCSKVFELYCTTNWRVERDAHGCELWVSDTRNPVPGENGQCIPDLDAGQDTDGGGGRDQ